jgi:predicted DNA-binding antitoxin AbrB/MazE fold protein
MSIIIEAIYEAGLLRPLEPLPALKDHTKVKITIETQENGDLTLPFQNLTQILSRIDSRREEIFRRRGEVEDSTAIIRESRERELE